MLKTEINYSKITITSLRVSENFLPQAPTENNIFKKSPDTSLPAYGKI